MSKVYKCKECNFETLNCKSIGAHVTSKHRIIIRKKRQRIKIKKICSKCKAKFYIERVIINNKPFIKKHENKFCSSFCSHSRIKTKETSLKVKNTWKLKFPKTERKCLNCKNTFFVSGKITKKCCSHKCSSIVNGKNPETRRKISEATKGKNGGWRNFGGNGKKGKYRNVVFQSSWELAWIIYNFCNKIKFKRCKEFYLYKDEKGIERKYYPDFILIKENKVIEIKGFYSKNVLLKLEALKNQNINFEVIDGIKIKPYLEFCKTNRFFKNVMKKNL